MHAHLIKFINIELYGKYVNRIIITRRYTILFHFITLKNMFLNVHLSQFKTRNLKAPS